MQYGSLREKIAAERGEREARNQRFADAYREAYAAGQAAAAACQPRAMAVYEDQGNVRRLIDIVPEGPCGFAWVTVRPGTCAFARWLVKQGHARKAYGGGVEIWIGDYGQSVDRKSAHAVAMAETLRQRLAGPVLDPTGPVPLPPSELRITAGSRLD